MPTCGSRDLALRRGVAVRIREAFGVDGLHAPSSVPGLAAWPIPLRNTASGGRLYLLVTKEVASDKPSLAHVFAAIDLFSVACRVQGARAVVTPRIACGLDGHDWPTVRGHLIDSLAANAPCVNRIVVVVPP